jgi:hypothetical protein
MVARSRIKADRGLGEQRSGIVSCVGGWDYTRGRSRSTLADVKSSVKERAMTFRDRVIIAVLWTLSLVGLAVITSSAQSVRHDPAAVISGNDIGFRPEGWRGKARTGVWVVRINGEWVEAADSIKTQPATTR